MALARLIYPGQCFGVLVAVFLIMRRGHTKSPFEALAEVRKIVEARMICRFGYTHSIAAQQPHSVQQSIVAYVLRRGLPTGRLHFTIKVYPAQPHLPAKFFHMKRRTREMCIQHASQLTYEARLGRKRRLILIWYGSVFTMWLFGSHPRRHAS